MNKEDYIAMGISDVLAEKAAIAFAEGLKGFVPMTCFSEMARIIVIFSKRTEENGRL